MVKLLDKLLYKCFKVQKSQVFVSVLIVVTIVFALGIAVLFYSRTLRDASSLQADTDRASSLARSGMHIAEHFLAEETYACGCIKDETYNLGDGSVRVEIDTSLQSIQGAGMTYVVSGDYSATGSVGRSVRVFEETVNSPLIGWARVYGEAGDDLLGAFQVTPDGYILGGDTDSFGATVSDLLLVKTDFQGRVDPDGWARTYAGASGDFLFALQQVADGYIFGGRSDSFPTGTNALLIKTDLHGVVDWARTYGGAITGVNSLNALQQVQDDYILAGETRSFGAGEEDFLLIKTNSDGEVDPNGWARTYGGTDHDYLHDLQQIPDGYILGGESDSFGAGTFAFDMLLIRTDLNGVVDWARTYGGAVVDYFQCLQQIPGGYILGGSTNSFGLTSYDFLLIKTDADGVVDWANAYDVGSNAEDVLNYVQPTSDGYLLGGRTAVDDFLVIKTDLDGEVVWAKTYGGADQEILHQLQQTTDGYILAGQTRSTPADEYDFFLIKTDPQGQLDCCDIVDDVTGDIVRTPLTIGCGDDELCAPPPLIIDLTSDCSGGAGQLCAPPPLNIACPAGANQLCEKGLGTGCPPDATHLCETPRALPDTPPVCPASP